MPQTTNALDRLGQHTTAYPPELTLSVRHLSEPARTFRTGRPPSKLEGIRLLPFPAVPKDSHLEEVQ
jgi:hypothetical protein